MLGMLGHGRGRGRWAQVLGLLRLLRLLCLLALLGGLCLSGFHLLFCPLEARGNPSDVQVLQHGMITVTWMGLCSV